MNNETAEIASCQATQSLLSRKEQAILDAAESGQNVEAVIKRENAIEEAERERKMRLLAYAS